MRYTMLGILLYGATLPVTLADNANSTLAFVTGVIAVGGGVSLIATLVQADITSSKSSGGTASALPVTYALPFAVAAVAAFSSLLMGINLIGGAL